MLYLVLFLSLLLLAVGCYHRVKKLPEGLSFESPEHPVSDARFLRDLTWVDRQGLAHHDQQIFDEVVRLVKGAKRFILLDMFLFNNLRGAVAGGYRNLSGELTDALLNQKKKYPGINIILVTDPVNTVYGGYDNPYLERLEKSGIKIVVADLDVLRDSNLPYSPFWRLFVKPFGSGKGRILPNPLGPGKVSVRSYLRMFNFKANHRKVIIVDQGKTLAALVTSANLHDGSSTHGNVAVEFSGPAAGSLMASEEAVIKFSGGNKPPDVQPVDTRQGSNYPGIRVLTEGKIKQALLAEIAATDIGDQLVMVLFYLSDREIVTALKKACLRGVFIRIVLDPNKDAFGRSKNGIPNRQVAAELAGEGIVVRWGNTHGEQLHSKMTLVDFSKGRSSLLVGSANLTRRNLDDYNLETNVLLRGNSEEKVFVDGRSYFNLLWNNDADRELSLHYSKYADTSILRKCIYRCIEAAGTCSF